MTNPLFAISLARPRGGPWLGLAALAVCAVALAARAPAAQPAPHVNPADIIATIGSTSITLAEVDDKALQQQASDFGSVTLAQALYDARRAALDTIVSDRLLDQEAKARGIDRTALYEQEVSAHVAAVTDAEAAVWYAANSARVRGAALDQVRAPIKALLAEERMKAAYEQYVNTLKRKTTIRILLEPPRQAVKRDNRLAKGPENAPIEMIEFSDFQCPFCLRANPTVKQVLDAYGDRIHFVYRHYPLPNHPNARPAAEAAECAAEQQQFWPYHDRLFANAAKLSTADLKQAAKDLGLDAARFNACVDARKYKAQVDEDVQAGTAAGVDGTPSFFINGRIITGAQSFDAFKRLIDDELELKQSAR